MPHHREYFKLATDYYHSGRLEEALHYYELIGGASAEPARPRLFVKPSSESDRGDEAHREPDADPDADPDAEQECDTQNCRIMKTFLTRFSFDKTAAITTPEGIQTREIVPLTHGGQVVKGSYGVMYLVNIGDVPYVMKYIEPKRDEDQEHNKILDEIKYLKQFAPLHNVPNFYGAFYKQDEHNSLVQRTANLQLDNGYYIYQEFCPGGELFDYIVSREAINEQNVMKCVRTMCSVMAKVHEEGVFHRDLKPENFILAKQVSEGDPDPDWANILRLIDFGLAIDMVDGDKPYKYGGSGTLSYMAPEVLAHGEYKSNCDVWSIGVIAYILLTGYPPHPQKNTMREQLMDIPREVQWIDPATNRNRKARNQAERCVNRMMTYEMGKRPTFTEILNEPWFTGEEHGGGGDLREGKARVHRLRKTIARIRAKEIIRQLSNSHH